MCTLTPVLRVHFHCSYISPCSTAAACHFTVYKPIRLVSLYKTFYCDKPFAIKFIVIAFKPVYILASIKKFTLAIYIINRVPTTFCWVKCTFSERILNLQDIIPCFRCHYPSTFPYQPVDYRNAKIESHKICQFFDLNKLNILLIKYDLSCISDIKTTQLINKI